MTVLAAFNNVIMKFIEDLIETFPEEKEFKVFKNGLLLLKKTNPRKVLELFKYYSINFKEQINKQDETFFINTDSATLSESSDNYVTKILDKLKVYWNLLSDTNKAKIWQYLNTLIKLSEKC